MKYSNEHNFIGVSFIAEDEDDTHYLDDKCFEDILDELDGRSNNTNANTNSNNSNKKYGIYSSQASSYKNINNINNPYINKNQIASNEKYFYSSASKFYPNPYKKITNNQSEINNINNNSRYNNENYAIKNLKDSFNILMGQIEPSQNAKITLASILKQLGYSDTEIIRTIGNYRGVISMSNANNRYKK